jgi:hypothetical protein
MMQGTRSAVGILAALCLLALPATASGQTSEQAAVDTDVPVYVTWEGAPDYWFSVDMPAEVHAWGERGYQGLRVSMAASDQRVSGEQITVAVEDSASSEEAVDLGRGTRLMRIENAEGAWQGPVTAVSLPDGLWVRYGWLTGEGAYEGLSYFYSYHDDTASDVHHGQGMIWPGEPPTVPDPALLDADPLN